MAKDHVWVFFGTGEDDSIVAYYSPATRSWMPLLTSDESALPTLSRAAQSIADRSGKRVECVRFDRIGATSAIAVLTPTPGAATAGTTTAHTCRECGEPLNDEGSDSCETACVSAASAHRRLPRDLDPVPAEVAKVDKSND